MSSNSTTLNLSNLQLTESDLVQLIPVIKKLNINCLYLSDNKLKQLPDSIGDLINLLKLDLSGNELEALPNSMSNLTNLEILDLSDNKFKELLPDFYLLFQNLETLKISKNEITTIDNQEVTRLTLGKLYEQNTIKSDCVLTKLNSMNLKISVLNSKGQKRERKEYIERFFRKNQ